MLPNLDTSRISLLPTSICPGTAKQTITISLCICGPLAGILPPSIPRKEGEGVLYSPEGTTVPKFFSKFLLYLLYSFSIYEFIMIIFISSSKPLFTLASRFDKTVCRVTQRRLPQDKRSRGVPQQVSRLVAEDFRSGEKCTRPASRSGKPQKPFDICNGPNG